MRALLSRSLWSMSSSSSRCAIPSSLSSSSSYSIPSYAGDASSSSLSSSRGDGGAGGGTYDDDRCPIRRAPPRIVVVVAPARRLRSTVPIRTADDANRDRGTRNANLHRGVAVDDIDDDDNDDDNDVTTSRTTTGGGMVPRWRRGGSVAIVVVVVGIATSTTTTNVDVLHRASRVVPRAVAAIATVDVLAASSIRGKVS